MPKTYKGVVASVTVSGFGLNSAQLEVYVTDNPDGAQPATFIVLAYPATEPYVFASFCNLASTALTSGKPVEITYDTYQGHANYLTGFLIKK